MWTIIPTPLQHSINLPRLKGKVRVSCMFTVLGILISYFMTTPEYIFIFERKTNHYDHNISNFVTIKKGYLLRGK